MTYMKVKFRNFLIALAIFANLYPAAAQDTVFTYQGQILDNGTNFTGTGQFKFALVGFALGGQQATATASVASGFVINYTITSGGSGYTSVPTVTISGGGGSGATASAIIGNGAVTAINAIQAGSGYSSPPTITIGLPGGYVTYWSNDGTSSGEPSNAVPVAVNNGLFSVALGDATLSNMMVISAGLFVAQTNLQLQIWFSDGVNGFAALSPLQNLTPVPYSVATGNLLGTVPAGQVIGALSSAQLPGAVLTNNQSGVTLNGTFSGNGASLSNLNASQLSGATVPAAALPVATSISPGVVQGDGATTSIGATGIVSVVGSALTGLNANNITSGSVPIAALANVLYLLTNVVPGYASGSVLQDGPYGTLQWIPTNSFNGGNLSTETICVLNTNADNEIWIFGPLSTTNNNVITKTNLLVIPAAVNTSPTIFFTNFSAVDVADLEVDITNGSYAFDATTLNLVSSYGLTNNISVSGIDLYSIRGLYGGGGSNVFICPVTSLAFWGSTNAIQP